MEFFQKIRYMKKNLRIKKSETKKNFLKKKYSEIFFENWKIFFSEKKKVFFKIKKKILSFFLKINQIRSKIMESQKKFFEAGIISKKIF